MFTFIKKNKTLVFKVLVSSTLLYIILRKLDYAVFLDNFKQLDMYYIPLILLLLILNYIVSSYRWKALLVHENTDHITIRFLTALYFVGSFFNNFMPTSIGGDVYKIYRLGEKISSRSNAFSATFMERFTGVCALGFIALFSLGKLLGVWFILAVLWLFLGGYLGFRLFVALGTRIKFLNKIYNSLIIYSKHPRVVSVALLTSFIVQLLAIGTQYVIFLALGIKIPILFALFVLPVITLAGFFIPSLNGLGVQDTLYMTVFPFVGIPAELALSASVTYHLSRLVVSLIGGVIYAVNKEV